jgi:hypothetical protein
MEVDFVKNRRETRHEEARKSSPFPAGYRTQACSGPVPSTQITFRSLRRKALAPIPAEAYQGLPRIL